MGFLDEIKRLARPYEDEEDEEEFDDYEPVSRSERMDRTGGERLERRAAKSSQENTGTLYPVENERRSNKVVNIHTTTQLQVVLVKPERFENASEIADHLREKRTVVLNLESTNKDIARREGGYFYLHHHALQRGHPGRSDRRAGEQRAVLLKAASGERRPRCPAGSPASQAFWRSQNLDAGRIHFARADKIIGVPARCAASGGADILGDLIDELENNGLYF